MLDPRDDPEQLSLRRTKKLDLFFVLLVISVAVLVFFRDDEAV